MSTQEQAEQIKLPNFIAQQSLAPHGSTLATELMDGALFMLRAE